MLNLTFSGGLYLLLFLVYFVGLLEDAEMSQSGTISCASCPDKKNTNPSGFEENLKIIHCIGDSHSRFFYGQDKLVAYRNDSLIPCFKVYNIGPSLAYNLCVSGSTTRGREKVLDLLETKIPPGSRLLLCFGEVDCRHHILKQAEKQKTDVEVVVEDCVNRYFDFIKEIKAKGYEVIVWGVLPSAPDSGGMSQFRPKLGTCAERNALTRYFNETLKNLLHDESIKTISLFERLVDDTNTTKEEFFMDQNHLSQEMMPVVIEELRKHFNDMPVIQIPALTKICIGGKSAKKGWKIVNVNKAPYVDYVADYGDLSFIESNSVDEIYACNYLQRLGYRDEIIVALKEIHRVLKIGAIFRFSVLDLQCLCSLFAYPDIDTEGQILVMKLIFGNHADRTEFNNMGFNWAMAIHYLTVSRFARWRRIPEFKTFKEESSASVFGNNIMLNVEAVK